MCVYTYIYIYKQTHNNIMCSKKAVIRPSSFARSLDGREAVGPSVSDTRSADAEVHTFPIFSEYRRPGGILCHDPSLRSTRVPGKSAAWWPHGPGATSLSLSLYVYIYIYI